MEEQNVYQRLADHLSQVGLGYPIRETLLEILRENFNPAEAEIALALPTGVIPFSTVGVSEIGTRVAMSPEELESALERLAEKGLLYVGPTSTGEKGYALLQVGFGFPQTFFWKGEDTPHARKMALLVAKYFNREVTSEAYGSQSKQYRYIPVGKAIKPDLQAVFPVQLMEQVITQARRIAVAHCPCRVSYRLVGRGCEHPTEVCLKFDELADFVIDRGLARELTQGRGPRRDPGNRRGRTGSLRGQRRGRNQTQLQLLRLCLLECGQHSEEKNSAGCHHGDVLHERNRFQRMFGLWRVCHDLSGRGRANERRRTDHRSGLVYRLRCLRHGVPHRGRGLEGERGPDRGKARRNLPGTASKDTGGEKGENHQEY